MTTTDSYFLAHRGYWYTCPNGHIFNFSEYGGAMQMGRCKECGEAIGGGSSDTAVPWPRGSTTTWTISTLSPPGTPPSPPKVTLSGAAEEFRRSTPPNGTAKYRPKPLRIAGNTSPQVPAVSVEQEGDAPASPASSNGSHSTVEGPKKYKGVGTGRPQVGGAVNQGNVRIIQPYRQPRGPPAGAEDLGSKNFASRSKSRASIAGPLVRSASSFVVEAY